MLSALETAGIEVLEAVVMDGADYYSVVENMLLDHYGIDVMYLPFTYIWEIDEALAKNGVTAGEDIMIVTGFCYFGMDDLEDGSVYGTQLRTPYVHGEVTMRAIHHYLEGDLDSFVVHTPTVTIRSPVYTPGQNYITTDAIGTLTVEEACVQ